MLGGRVRWEALSVVGPLGDGVFRRVNVQKAFLGAAGFTIEAGLTDAMEEEAQIKRSMVNAAREVIARRGPHEVGSAWPWPRSAGRTAWPASFTDGGAPADMVAALRGRVSRSSRRPAPALPTAPAPGETGTS